MTTKMDVDNLEKYAGQIRAALPPNKQGEVFKLATEAGYLTALADGTEDEEERSALVESLETLSHGLVLEWEIEDVIQDTWGRVQAEGAESVGKSIGVKLKELDAIEAGLFVAAIVALTTSGLDKTEAEMLQTIGTAAGLANSKIGEIVKRAR